jgi:hypothetical protein
MPEACNGIDDDCNGQVDDGDPNMLCMSQGPQPPHANWVCANGMCKLGPCDPGWAAFPTVNPTTGCACQVDANEPNGTCAAAKDMGSVIDVGGSPIVIQGTLSGAGEVDFYTFESVDTPETGTNSYHVSIDITQPSPNSEFVMDVIRGGTCSNTPSGAGTGIISYDWCVNGAAAGPMGEVPCAPATANVPRCTDHSSRYYVRVYRASGATATCTQYQITVTGGGGSCDFTQQCM